MAFDFSPLSVLFGFCSILQYYYMVFAYHSATEKRLSVPLPTLLAPSWRAAAASRSLRRRRQQTKQHEAATTRNTSGNPTRKIIIAARFLLVIPLLWYRLHSPGGTVSPGTHVGIDSHASAGGRGDRLGVSDAAQEMCHALSTYIPLGKRWVPEVVSLLLVDLGVVVIAKLALRSRK